MVPFRLAVAPLGQVAVAVIKPDLSCHSSCLFKKYNIKFCGKRQGILYEIDIGTIFCVDCRFLPQCVNFVIFLTL